MLKTHSPTDPPPFPASLVLSPVSRRPTRLQPSTVDFVLTARVPGAAAKAVEPAPAPRASIVIVTLDNLVYTKLCVESIWANTDGCSYEVIVVDNGSSDGTGAYLREAASARRNLHVVFNEQNRGFAAGVNQGVARAAADTLVLLNDDTIVTPGWLNRLLRPLDDDGVGLVGPRTNRAPNESQIDARYHTYGELLQFADELARTAEDQVFDIPVLTMFCLAMRSDTYQRLGPLDERFETGMFEDDDYAMRARMMGYRVICAQDAFIHHFGEVAMGRLAPSGEYAALFEANRRRFEQKWGLPWQPHRRIDGPYQQLVERIRQVACHQLPPNAAVVVISRGDDGLLALNGRRAWHFPQGADGAYAGHYPGTSAEAIAQLEALRARGAEFLLVPSPAFWWLAHYADLGRYLETSGRLVMRDDTCAIFQLPAAETIAPPRGADGNTCIASFPQAEQSTRPVQTTDESPRATTIAIDSNDAEQRRLLSEVFPRYRDEYEQLSAAPVTALAGDGLDALALYCMVRAFQPGAIVQVGGRHSSQLLARAALRSGRARFVCIEPDPEPLLAAGFPGLTYLVRQRLHEVGREMFERLQVNDIVFIDSSCDASLPNETRHDLELILPLIAPGVLVRVDDACLPSNSTCELLFSSRHLGSKYLADIERIFPALAQTSRGRSAWLRRKPAENGRA